MLRVYELYIGIRRIIYSVLKRFFCFSFKYTYVYVISHTHIHKWEITTIIYIYIYKYNFNYRVRDYYATFYISVRWFLIIS